MKEKLTSKDRPCAIFLSILLVFLSLTPIHAKEPSRVETLRSGMSLRERITQMMMVDFRYWEGQDFTTMNPEVENILKNYHFGSVIVFSNNIKNPEQILQLTKDMQSSAIKNQGIPLLITADQEGGSVVRLSFGTSLPGNMALGAAGSEEYAFQAGQILGRELQAVGINSDLAPVADVNSNAMNPIIGLRSFSDDASTAGTMAASMIQGMHDENLAACAKHFPGHGDTSVDSHYGLPMIDKSLSELYEAELLPFQMAIEQDVDMIMTAHILFPQLDSSTILSQKTGKEELLPATMSGTIISDLLKEDMGYDGIVCTDSLEMAAIANVWDPVQAAINSINAGADMLCMPCSIHSTASLDALDTLIHGIIDAVKDGRIAESRIDDAVTRILKVKEKRGILDYDASKYTLKAANSIIGSDEHQQIEREMAASAITLIQNKNRILPISPASENRYLFLVPTDYHQQVLTSLWDSLDTAGTLTCTVYDAPEMTSSLKNQILKTDMVFLLSSVSNTNQMQLAPLDIAEYAHKNGKPTLVISAALPYDVQLYTHADAVLAVYGSYQDVNLKAGLQAIFGISEISGTLPVDIPKYDPESGQYTSSMVYNRGEGLTFDSFLPIHYTSDMQLTQKWNATDPTVFCARTKKVWFRSPKG